METSLIENELSLGIECKNKVEILKDEQKVIKNYTHQAYLWKIFGCIILIELEHMQAL